MHRLADALDHMFTAAGDAVRDPTIAEHARGAARSLAEALSVTFGDVSDGLRERFKQTGPDKPPAEIPPKE
jgi:hypothetical protein